MRGSVEECSRFVGGNGVVVVQRRCCGGGKDLLEKDCRVIRFA